MRLRILVSLSLPVLLLAGCAATTPPPRFGPVSPADADGPGSATPAARPTLATEPEALAPAPAAPPENDHEAHPTSTGHEHAGHAPASPASPGRAAPAAESYTCAMHPEVSQPEPGHCPRCGMPLVKRDGGENEQ